MSSRKYKVCPVCGAHNAPSAFDCEECGADLVNERVVDPDVDAPAGERDGGPTPAETPAGDGSRLVRRCTCGAENPPQARKCQVCGEDIGDILPEPATSGSRSFALEALDGSYRLAIDAPETVIGREAILAEHLPDKLYVSRRHARLLLDGGQVFIENVSGTNRTFLNDVELPDATPMLLHDGDEIGLGGKVIDGWRQDLAAYLTFRVTG